MSARHAPARTILLAVAGALAGLLVAVVVTLLARPPYATQTELYFKPGATLDATATARVASYAAMVDRAGVTARVLPGSLVVRVRAQADSAAQATSRLAAGVTSLREQATAGEPTTRGLTAAVVAAPTTPERGAASWWPHLGLGLLAGLVVGLLAAAAVALGRRRPVHDDPEPELPTLAQVGVSGQVSALLTPSEEEATGLRDLASAVAFFDVDSDGTAIVVASLQTDHDGTEVATQLATDLARRDRSVVLVDADLRHRRVADLLGLDADRGLVDVLAGDAAADAAIQVHRATGLHALVAGRSVPDPRSLVASHRLADLVRDLRAEYDTVVVTGSPLAEADDAALLAPATDGLAVVVRSGRADDRDVHRALERAEAFGARVRGLVSSELALRRPAPVEPVPEVAVAAPLGWSDEVEPAATTDTASGTADELVFPQPLAELGDDAPPSTPRPDPEPEPVLADRFPAQRTETDEPEQSEQPEPLEQPEPPEADGREDSTRVSLLEDFLTEEDDQLDQQPDPAAGDQPAEESERERERVAPGGFADDLSDEADTMWRPSHWSDVEKS